MPKMTPLAKSIVLDGCTKEERKLFCSRMKFYESLPDWVVDKGVVTEDKKGNHCVFFIHNGVKFAVTAVKR